MLPLDDLDWDRVRGLYDRRRFIHNQAKHMLMNRRPENFAELVLGVADSDANYSASQHGLGPLVLASNSDAARRVQKTAKEFARLTDATAVPAIIRRAGLQYFQIAVGSEVSCIVNPNVCWVANRRTIWAGLVEKHEGDVSKANQALALYLEPDVDSEMHYSKWTALHEDLGDRMRTLAREGAKVARKSGVSAGTLTFLWADSIAAWLYEELHG